MNKQIITQTLLIFVLPFMIITCSKDEIQAEDSIEGTWDVIEITSLYGDFSQNGFIPSETITESGELGSFIFMPNLVDYNFTRNDTLFNGSGSWNLKAEKVTEGFSKYTKFTVSIEDHLLFETTFEDGTKNSEKKAKRVTFIETPSSGFGVLIEMLLQKK